MNAVLILLFFVMGFSGAISTQFIVGDSMGWTDPSKSNVSYADWALKHRFHVGDSLVFKYSADSHTVLKVNRQDFEACHTSNSMAAYKDGESVVHLTTPGPHWYICGEQNHCAAGQKFGIMVVERRGRHRASPPAFAPSPSPGPEQDNLPAPIVSSQEPTSSPTPAVAPTAGSITVSSLSVFSLSLVLAFTFYISH